MLDIKRNIRREFSMLPSYMQVLMEAPGKKKGEDIIEWDFRDLGLQVKEL